MLKGLIYEKEDKTMNNKMTTNNYQQLNLNNKKQETKQTTTAEKESQKWRSHGYYWRGGGERMREKVQGIRSILVGTK